MPSDDRTNNHQATGSQALATRASCEAFSFQLAEMADGRKMLEPQATSHFDSCLRCQAELAQYKKLRRALASLREHRFSPDESLVQEILNALEPGGTVYRLQRLTTATRSRKVAYIGGIAAAATAGAAGAMVIASRLAARQRLAS